MTEQRQGASCTRHRRRSVLQGIGAALSGTMLGLSGCLYVPVSGGSGSGSGSGGGSGIAGAGGTPEEFGWEDPPQREQSIQTSEVGGLQAGLDSLESGTELVIDDGPYTETVDIPDVDSITITGGEGGAVLENPGTGTLISTPGWSLERTSCEALDAGASDLSVGDGSIFSEGDDIRIYDPDELYLGMGGSDLNNTANQRKGEFATVDSVDGDTVQLQNGTIQGYENPSGSLEVARIDWGVEDLHITNVVVRGGVSDPYWRAGSDARGMFLSQSKNVWVTNCEAYDWNLDGIGARELLNYYVENCYIENVDRYGISCVGGTTHARVQNCVGQDIHPPDSGYLVMAGGGSDGWSDVARPTYDIQAAGCHVDTADFLYEAHFGAQAVRFHPGSIEPESSGICKMRGVGQHCIGGEYVAPDGWPFQSTQVVRETSVEEVYVEGGGQGWVLWPKEDNWFGDLLMRDVQFVDMSGDPIYFRSTDGGQPPEVRGIHVENSAWNGEWIDDARIEDCQGFDASRIDYSTEYPDQSVQEYFGNAVSEDP